MTLEELRNAVCRHIDENRDAYNETGDECYRAVKEELLHILGLIDTVDHDPVGNPEQLTLTELAREMRKLFEFDYVTVDANESITFWVRKPLYISMCGLWERNTYLNSWDIFDIDFSSAVNLDLSEYADESGEIDYSRCIVEVSDDAE